ncbi:hypothetical protein [Amycolatopsis viridis]|uniref:Tetratricopeptide (TPR) repeat protein n=1 Tax=Amycolatopsis viridis TaxID=185678 RepID=A0ABX0SZK1_9PSEU|nr:hypothetical protein [Amycolatopsis viridis]NIH81074.1 tetratricopeptide (TPR) repeat protein [Amycolatopsis viridis]
MADFGRRDFDDAASDRPRRRDSAPGAGRSGAQRGTPHGKAGQGGRSGGYGRQDDNRSSGRDFGGRRGGNSNDRGGRDFGDRRSGGTGRTNWNRDDDRRGGTRGGDRSNWKRDDDRRGGSRGGERPGWNRDDNRGGSRGGGDRPNWKRDDDRRGGDRPGWKRDDNRGDRTSDNRRGDRPYGDRRGGSYDSRGGARGDRPYGDRRSSSYDNRGGERGDRASGERRGSSFDKRGSFDARRGERSYDDRRAGSSDNRRGERSDRRGGSFDDRRGERSFDKRSGGSFGGRDRSADKRGGSFDSRGRDGGDRSADRRGDRPYDRGGRPGFGERDRSSGNRGGRSADDRRGGYGKRDDDRRGGRSFDDRRGARDDTRSAGRNFGDRDRGTVDRPGGKFADRPARSGRDDERVDRAVPAPDDRTEQPIADEAIRESAEERHQEASPRDEVTTPDTTGTTGTEADDETGPLGAAAAEETGSPDDDDLALVERAAQPVTREEQVDIADAEFRRAPREERRADDRRGKRGRDLDDAALARELLEAPELPEDIEFSDLDPEIRRDLRTLPKSLAEIVGKHLVAAGNLIDTDPEAALAHAKFAKTRASRVPIVREALGLVAYHAGRWQEALAELRAVRRMTHTDQHVAVIADAERALGRPERALDLAKEMQGRELPRDVEIELKIVAAGARRDLGQVDAAVVSLQGDDLDPRKRDPWSARLFYAYADNLLAADRRDEAIRWFLHAADADEDEETDAAERAAELADG